MTAAGWLLLALAVGFVFGAIAAHMRAERWNRKRRLYDSQIRNLQRIRAEQQAARETRGTP